MKRSKPLGAGREAGSGRWPIVSDSLAQRKVDAVLAADFSEFFEAHLERYGSPA